MNSLRYLKYPAFLVPAFAMGISVASADEHECDCPCDKETTPMSAKHDDHRSVAGEMHRDSARDKAVFTSNSADKPNASSASKPSDNAAKPSDNAAKPSDNAAKPSANAVKPSDNAVKPSDNTAKPSANAAKPSDNAAKPSDNAAKPSANATKPSANANDSNKNYLAVTPANNYFSTKIIGQDVTNNRNDEVIGTVEEILIDRDGQVGAVILSIGGLMGLGKKDVAIAWDKIDRTMGDDNEVKLSVDFSEASLADAPAFVRK